MIRHYIIAALRNMAANKLLSAISTLGLSVGITAAILMALVIRNQMTYDHFLPANERTYVVVTRFSAGTFGDQPSMYGESADNRMADLLRLNAPQIEAVTRLDGTFAKVRRDQIAAREDVEWADPNLFKVLQFPVLHGDPLAALNHPDGIVLPRSQAIKYFGRDDVVGRIIEIDGHPFMVGAVIKDMPQNATRFENDIYASGLSLYSHFSTTKPLLPGQFAFFGSTYVRLKPGASASDVDIIMPRLFEGLAHNIDSKLMRLDRAHMSEDLNPAITAKLGLESFTTLLILFISGVNFVNLMVARSSRREKEVGVRMTCGANRGALMLQFLGEAVIAVALATIVAMVLAEWVLPSANAFLQSGAAFDYRNDTYLILFLLPAVVVLGVIAGAYPAFLLSALKPSSVIRGWANGTAGTGHIRNVLVMLQFSILIVLAIAAGVVYQQRNYVAREALRANIDQTLVVRAACPTGFRDALRNLTGVKGVACAGSELLDGEAMTAHPYKGKPLILDTARVERNIFAQFALWPVAGTLPSQIGAREGSAPGLVINMAAVKRMGFASPKAALGQGIWQEAPWGNLRVVAVVPDFALNNFRNVPIPPTIYTEFGNEFDPPKDGDMIYIKLDGRRIPETLAAIDHLWDATGGQGNINRFFLDVHIQEHYISILRQAQLFAVCVGIAIFLACLGLIGIATSIAERRTKEIGVRKVMGANNTKIVALLLWQFSQPVLFANLVAWPVAWWLMHRWLSGFAYHVDLQLWMFVAAGAATLLIALLTVGGQAMLVARQKPVLALRYE